jgi:preprotein translocase subunit YajC
VTTTLLSSAGLLAADSSTKGGGGLGGLLIFVVPVALMAVLLSRSNRKRRTQAQSLIEAVSPGAQVMTTGGLFGTVRSVDDEALSLEIAPGVVVRYAKAAVARIITPEPAVPEGPPSGSSTDVID